MAIFPEFQTEEWAFFAILLSSLAIFAGGNASYGGYWLINGAGQLLLLPIEHIVYPLIGTGSIALGVAGGVLLILWFGKMEEWFTVGFLGAVVVGAIVLSLGA